MTARDEVTYMKDSLDGIFIFMRMFRASLKLRLHILTELPVKDDNFSAVSMRMAVSVFSML